MSRNFVLTIAFVLVSGFAITLISGLYEQNLSIPGHSLFGYGLPLNWYRRGRSVVYPEPPEHHEYLWENFVLDFIFWSLVVTIVIIAVSKFLKKPVF